MNKNSIRHLFSIIIIGTAFINSEFVGCATPVQESSQETTKLNEVNLSNYSFGDLNLLEKVYAYSIGDINTFNNSNLIKLFSKAYKKLKEDYSIDSSNNLKANMVNCLVFYENLYINNFCKKLKIKRNDYGSVISGFSWSEIAKKVDRIKVFNNQRIQKLAHSDRWYDSDIYILKCITASKFFGMKYTYKLAPSEFLKLIKNVLTLDEKFSKPKQLRTVGGLN